MKTSITWLDRSHKWYLYVANSAMKCLKSRQPVKGGWIDENNNDFYYHHYNKSFFSDINHYNKIIIVTEILLFTISIKYIFKRKPTWSDSASASETVFSLPPMISPVKMNLNQDPLAVSTLRSDWGRNSSPVSSRTSRRTASYETTIHCSDGLVNEWWLNEDYLRMLNT